MILQIYKKLYCKLFDNSVIGLHHIRFQPFLFSASSPHQLQLYKTNNTLSFHNHCDVMYSVAPASSGCVSLIVKQHYKMHSTNNTII